MTISFSYFYNDVTAQQIELEEIRNFLEDQLFVTVGGNSNCISEKLKYGLPVFNANLIAERYERKIFEHELVEAFYCKESFIHVGKNNNIETTKKRLLYGKEFGFTNILVHVGKDNDSLNVFNSLKENYNLVDFYVKVSK